MGGIYRVARGIAPDPGHDNLEVVYGWGPLHMFLHLLAIEEHVDLPSMRDFGGDVSWSQSSTALRPLFDSSLQSGRIIPAEFCEGAARRLMAIREKWQAGGLASVDMEPWMRDLQLQHLDSLITILEAGASTGRGVSIE